MMAKSPDLSIIIVSYNTKKITENCIKSILTSLKNTTYNIELIIVDNASNDGSVELLQSLSQTMQSSSIILKTIFNTQNLGFAKANNQGVKYACAPYILLLNSDILVIDNGIEKLFDFYKKNKNAHFMGAKLFNKDMSSQASSAPFYTLPVVFAALFLRGDYLGITRSSPHIVKQVDWVSGACIITKKNYYEKVGGFDERIFMYMDEVDLLYRAKKQGMHTYFYPDAHFIHLGSASSNGKTFPIIQVYRGFLFFYQKHYSELSLRILKFMLQLKAVISIIIGYLINSTYLKKTYEEAYKLAR